MDELPLGSVGEADRFALARGVVLDGLARRVFPAVVVEVGRAAAATWREAFGRLTYDDDAAATTTDTIFDLASLTKVIATTSLALERVTAGKLGLDDPVAAHVPAWKGLDRQAVTLRDLLSHCSGLPAHLPLYQTCPDPVAFEKAICKTPLAYAPHTAAVYSDLGFILLWVILSRRAGLTGQFDALCRRMGIDGSLRFLPPDDWRDRTAPTGYDDWRGRLLVGEVHDRNTWALGGVAGHAGLFGTAAAVGTFARHLLAILRGTPGAFDAARLRAWIARRDDVPNSSRALGWDTAMPTSSSGSRMSPRGFGHTGFTGTSLWIDQDRGVYVVLLTNRVHPTAASTAIRPLRAAFHDAVIEGVDAPR